jgi:hypothetical protein
MALTADRDTVRKEGVFFERPVAADTIIYAGAMVALDADGNLVPVSADPDLKVDGRAEGQVNNSGGAAGDKTCRVRRGCFRFDNSATDPITLAAVNDTAYAEDDETVALTDATSTLPAAGTIMDVDDLGVWINI